MRLVLANPGTIHHPTAGGHLSVRLQYMLALQSMGVDWFFLQLMHAGPDVKSDERLVEGFFSVMRQYGLQERVIVLRFTKWMHLETADVYGSTPWAVKQLVADADIVWNFCNGLSDPLLSRFKRRAFVDLDPGIIQATDRHKRTDELAKHDILFTVGLNIHGSDTLVPDLGFEWKTFLPPVYLAHWETDMQVEPNAPFSSVTHWTWGHQLRIDGRLISTSKRDAYLRYLHLPQKVDQPFELAVHLREDDPTGERVMLESHGWRVSDPRDVAGTPRDYRAFIAGSKAEFSCPKPAFRTLRTGWFSDRSAAYLASGRPVLAEDTGFAKYLPTGLGLLTFSNEEEALEGLHRINSDYPQHASVARQIAEEHLDATKVIASMIDAC